MANTEHTPDTPVHPDIRFEPTDVSSRGLVIAGAILLVAIWCIVLLLHVAFSFFSYERAQASPAAGPMAAQQNSEPPLPKLQAEPQVDLQHLREFEESKLNTYGWIDKQKGVVSIPIDRAMQLLAQRGIPAQKTPADLKLVPPTAGTRMTGFEGKVEPEPR